MPEICRFLGITIYLYYDDHDPPHFHAKYGHNWAAFDMKTLALLSGELPRRAHGLVVEWALQHRPVLLELWQLAKDHQPLPKLPPLD